MGDCAGSVYSRGGIAEWGGPVEEGSLGDCEGLITQLLGDGKPYAMILCDKDGHQYSARFNTRQGFNNIRLPFNKFRAINAPCPPLDPSTITMIKFR